MLEVLKIRNLAIIDELEVEFSEGLNILTGETGAGKSIIISSFELISGKRAQSDIIREGEDRCEIEALFYEKDEPVVVKRVITRKNRSRNEINGSLVSLNELKSFSENMLTVSTQNSFLFSPENQMRLYDEFCGVKKEREKFSELLKEHKEIEKKIMSYREKKEENSKRLEVLNFQIKEIEEIEKEDIDEEELKQKISYYENLEAIREAVNFAIDELSTSDNSVISKLSCVKEKIISTKNTNKKLEDVINLLNEAESSISDAVNLLYSEASDWLEDVDIDRLIEIENRIDFLKKKYNVSSLKELISLKKVLEKEKEDIETSELDLQSLIKRKNKIEQELKKLSDILHLKRSQMRSSFEEGINTILKELKMDKAKFFLSIRETTEYSSYGKDYVEFLISTNPGETPKPVKDIASGGEKSRILLALKAFLSKFFKIPILVFDEIDTGTGGETAFAIGKLLKRLSTHHQIFVITHFPQVAAFADSHYRVYKVEENGRTFTRIEKLSFEERKRELARMIAGNITDASLTSAEELIHEAEKSNC